MKVLLKRFHLNGNTTAGQDYNLELLDIQTKYIVSCKSTAGEVSFKWLHHIGFYPQAHNLELHTKQIIPCERTAKEVTVKFRK